MISSDAKLPAVLSGLLYRLLVLFDLNARAFYASSSSPLDERCAVLREQMQVQVPFASLGPERSSPRDCIEWP
jgi:hypothetical protein